MRTLHLPGRAMALLRRRADGASSDWVFPSTVGTLRDPENTRTQLRKAVA